MGKISEEGIEQRIYVVRGHRVMMDSDLAAVYGVSTIRLNQQVSRNRERFPEDFMFQLSQDEAESLRLHFCNLKAWPRRPSVSALRLH